MTRCGRVNLPKYTINEPSIPVEYAKSHILLCVYSTIQLLLKIVSERGENYMGRSFWITFYWIYDKIANMKQLQRLQMCE